MKNKVVIGVDQSYADTGITILYSDGTCSINSVYGKDISHSEYRELIKSRLHYELCTILDFIGEKDVTVIVERISMRASKGGLSQSYVKSNAALIAVIIDVCSDFNIPVYSVDTASWKAQIVGTKKPMQNKYGIPSEKYPTILYMKRRGLLKEILEEYEGKGSKGVISVLERSTGQRKRYKVNDNKADSYCIAQYGFLPKEKQKLQLERF